MANIEFTLGNCNYEGKNYRFDYNNGAYLIFLLENEQAKVLEKFNDSKAAYARWNDLKRPEKRKKL